MRFLAKNSLFGVVLMGFVSIQQAQSQPLCSQIFYYQKAVLYTLTGNHVTSLAISSADTLVQNIGAIPNLHYSDVTKSYENLLSFRTPMKFKSECAPYPGDPTVATYAIRDSGEIKTHIEEGDRFIRYRDTVNFSGNVTLQNAILVYEDTAANPSDFIIKDTDDGIFKATYGSAFYYDTLRTGSGNLKGLGYGFMDWTIKFDTSYFMEDLRNSSLNGVPTDNPNWNDPADVASRNMVVHILVAHYDTVETFDVTTPVAAKLPQRAPIQISKMGGVYQILVPLDNRGNESISLDILDMKGKKQITLNSSTGVFQWDGHSAGGQKLPQGLYFLKFGNGRFQKLFVQ